MTAPVYLARPLGIDRSDDPLMSLEDACEPLRVLVMRSQWYFAYMTGVHRTFIGQVWEERRRNPQPGDLVYVPDLVLGDRDPTPYRSFGYYVAGRQEPVYGVEEWQEVRDQFEGKACPTEPVFYIQYGPAPNDVVRWENASCLVIATQDRLREVEAALQTRGM